VPEGRGAPPVAPPLYAGEYESEAGFGAELLQAYVEQGPNGCAAIFRASVADDCPALEDELAQFLQRHPRLSWIKHVHDAALAPSDASAAASLTGAARALYGWGLAAGGEGGVLDRKVMLSLGKLCHHAAFLRDAPPQSDDDVAAGLASSAPPVPGVLLAVDASEREEWRAVGVAAVDDEHYLLRMQEKLPWLCTAGGAAAPAEALLESLLATAASPAFCAERHVSQEEVLKLSLDVTHKSAWRLGESARGRAARSERLVRVLAAAANADGQAWLHLSSRLGTISETGLRKALLEGGTAEPATGDPRPLLLWSPLSWEADRLTLDHQIATSSLPIRSLLSREADRVKN